jgi:hypothetical protein
MGKLSADNSDTIGYSETFDNFASFRNPYVILI